MIELAILFLLVRNLGSTLRQKNRPAFFHQIFGSLVFFVSEAIGFAIAMNLTELDRAYIGSFILGGGVAYTYWRVVKKLPPLEVSPGAPTVVRPSTKPGDGTDFLLCIGVAVLLFGGIFVAPSVLVISLTSNTFAGVATLIGIITIWGLFTVWSLRVDRHGLTFVRALGFPHRLNWGEIESITVADRKETILRGWLWPPFPSREMSLSMSASDHIKIRTKSNRDVFYPASSIQEFERAVRQHWPGPTEPPLDFPE